MVPDIKKKQYDATQIIQNHGSAGFEFWDCKCRQILIRFACPTSPVQLLSLTSSVVSAVEVYGSTYTNTYTYTWPWPFNFGVRGRRNPCPINSPSLVQFIYLAFSTMFGVLGHMSTSVRGTCYVLWSVQLIHGAFWRFAWEVLQKNKHANDAMSN